MSIKNRVTFNLGRNYISRMHEDKIHGKERLCGDTLKKKEVVET